MTWISSLIAFAQITSPESLTLSEIQSKGFDALPMGERTAAVAKFFLGTPYEGGTLDRDPAQERCSVILDGLDCVTLFETSFAIARELSRPEALTLNRVRDAVQATRYRGGKVTDYASRIHYTSEWFLKNVQEGRVDNLMTSASGAVPYLRVTNFMTQNASKYPALVHNPNLIGSLAKFEDSLNRQPRRYFPLELVSKKQLRLLKTGDIVGICTSVDGLDCSHTGLILVGRDGTRQLLHASSSRKKVVISPSFEEYLRTNKNVIGYMAVRPR